MNKRTEWQGTIFHIRVIEWNGSQPYCTKMDHIIDWQSNYDIVGCFQEKMNILL